jgi:hypothetical protein
MDKKELCRACGQERDEHFLAIGSNGAVTAFAWGKDGTSVIHCFTEVSRKDFPACICCDESIIDDKAAHASCTQTIIDERDYFQTINKKYAGSNTYFYVQASNRLDPDYEVYQRTEHGDKRVAAMLRFHEAKSYCDRMNEARNRT